VVDSYASVSQVAGENDSLQHVGGEFLKTLDGGLDGGVGADGVGCEVLLEVFDGGGEGVGGVGAFGPGVSCSIDGCQYVVGLNMIDRLPLEL
jgi:hypothetical protein